MSEAHNITREDDPRALVDAVEESVRALMRDLARARFAHTERSREWTAAERQWVLRLVDVVDAFDRVLRNVESKPDRINDQMRIWIGNFKAVRRLVERQLADVDATRMPDETMFDPERHTAVETVDDESRPHGEITEVIRPGYQRSGEIVRKAEVRVIRNEM
jgi:molecular chaperone GrpE (heat shock protein)